MVVPYELLIIVALALLLAVSIRKIIALSVSLMFTGLALSLLKALILVGVPVFFIGFLLLLRLLRPNQPSSRR